MGIIASKLNAVTEHPVVDRNLTRLGLQGEERNIAVALSMVASIYLGKTLLLKAYHHYASHHRLSKAINQKRNQQEQAINEAKLDSKLTQSQENIISLSANALVHAIKDGRLTAQQIMEAFCTQAAIVHRAHNCLTEITMKQGLEDAQELDRQRKRQGKTNGILYGCPISLKDSIGVKNTDQTLGLVKYVDLPSSDDCLLVKALRDQGAIPFVKTNVPQTMISYECKNGIFGTTTNPYSREHTPGGSSGGEACLIAARGSPCGFGTDIGGSVRIPAHFSGIFALKPTARRVSLLGFRSSIPGQEAVPGVCGPMGNSVDDLATLMRAVLVKQVFQNDHFVVPLPFDEKSYSSNQALSIGYYLDDGFIAASPACQRAVKEAVNAMKAAGHKVKLFVPPRVPYACGLYYGLLGGDCGETMKGQIQGEVWEDYVSNMLGKTGLPDLAKSALSLLATHVAGDQRAGNLIKALKSKNVAGIWKLQGLRKAYRQEFLEAMNEQKVDILITPAHVLPAVTHGAYSELSFCACYTFLYNLLDLPAGIVPITSVRANDTWSSPANGLLEKKVRAEYDPVRSENCPVGVQVVGRPFKDEFVLNAMKRLSEAKSYHCDPATDFDLNKPHSEPKF